MKTIKSSQPTQINNSACGGKRNRCSVKTIKLPVMKKAA